MAKLKRNTGTKEPEKPVAPKATYRDGSWWHDFMADWGRLVIPVVLFGVPLGLNAMGWLSGNLAGYLLGLFVLLGLAAGYAWVLWSNAFPKWVTTASIVAAVMFLGGAVLPFTLTVFPGQPEAQVMVTKDLGEVPVSGLTTGSHMVQVFAKSFSETETKRGEGSYKLVLGGKELTGRFSDVMRQTKGRKGMTGQVEDKHLTEQQVVNFTEAPTAVKAVRVDEVIGPELLVSVYPVLLPPWASYVLLTAVLLLAIFLDGRFPEQTERWRLAPWAGMAVAFLIIFNSGYEPSKMPGATIWSAVFGGALGFTLGWLLSLIGRKVVGKIRTRM